MSKSRVSGVNNRYNAVGKAMLVMETIKSILLALVFMGIGVGIEYWALNYAPTEDGAKLGGISIGAVFFLVGVIIAITQLFQWRSVTRGPRGTATQWLYNRQRSQQMAANAARARAASRYGQRGGITVRF